MTDPRTALGEPGELPDVDLGAVRARAGQLRRRRRAVAVVSGGVAVAAAAALALLPTGLGSEALVPPLATRGPVPGVTDTPRTPAATPAPTTPATAPTSSTRPTPPARPGPSARPTPSAGPTPAATRPSGGTRPAATPTPATTPPTTTAGPPSTGPTAPAAPFPADDAPEAAAAGGAPAVLTGVTTGRQDGYDRVVYRFDGPAGALPGWRVAYVAKAVQDGSGEPVALEGDAVLQVVLTGTTAEGGSPYTGRARPGLDLLAEVVTAGPFEGQTTSFLGLAQRAPFRVLRLSAPTRVVVDVRTR